MSHDDFAFEPIPGVPKALPQGEVILWQGSPGPVALAWRSLFFKPVLAYFGLLVVWRIADAMSADKGFGAALSYALELVPVAAVALGLLGLLAWAYARSTVYTITSQRLIVRSGVALPITVNIPFGTIRSAGVAKRRDGRGEIALELVPDHRVAYLALWPHVRPTKFFPPHPLLVGLSDPERVADVLGRALTSSVSNELPVAPVVPQAARAEAAVRQPPIGGGIELGGAAS
jgi:hypothetical protein